MDKLERVIKGIGKPNFVLIILIIFVIVATGLYTTFSMYTSDDGFSIVDGIETYRFIINASNDTNLVTIPANSSKNVAITVNNPEDIKLRFGIYYSTSFDLENVSIGYLDSSDFKATDTMDANSNGIVTIKIYNDSNNDIMINFGLSYGLVNGGELKLDDNKYWVEKLKFERFNLNEVKLGSYISYVGDNECDKDNCNGNNASYTDDNLGFCKNESDRYQFKGWRLLYIKDLAPYIISAGSPECASSKNIEEAVLKYCNKKFIYGGNCSDYNIWNFGVDDFKYVTKKALYYNTLNDNSCFEAVESSECGYSNDLIDIGGWYWLLDEAGSDSLIYTWNPIDRFVYYGDIDEEYGIRPVIRLDTNIEVIDGKGTMDEPYIIKNQETYTD